MNKEQIRKAAENYAGKIRKELAFHIYAPYQVEDYVQEAFDDGAEWYINSVWHDANEQPDRGKDIIVMYSNKSCRVFLPNGIWDNLIKLDKFIKWAYIDDLLPNTDR